MKNHGLRRFGKLFMVVIIILMIASACVPNVHRFEERGKVEKLIKALDYERLSYVREDAALALGKLGDQQAVEPLIRVLKDDEEPGVRCAAAEALGEIGHPGAVDALIESSSDENDLVRKMSIASLHAIGEPAIGVLIEKLGSDSSADRQMAVEILSGFETMAVPKLIEALTDDVEKVQSGAHDVLLDIGSAAIPVLIQALSEENETLNEKVIQILIDFDTEAVQPLIDHLSDENIHSQVRAALVKMGAPAVVGILENVKNATRVEVGDQIIFANVMQFGPTGTAEGILADGDFCTESANWRGKIVICARGENSFYEQVLVVQEGGGVGMILCDNIKGQHLFPTLGEGNTVEIVSVSLNMQGSLTLRNESVGETVVVTSQDTSYAEKMLIEIGEPGIPYLIGSLEEDTLVNLIDDVICELGSSAVPPMIDALKEGNEDIQVKVLKIIPGLEDDRFISPVIDTLKSSDEKVRKQAAYALSFFETEEVVEPLIELLSDPEELVTEAAGDALIHIGLPAVEPLLAVYHDEESQARSEAESLLIDIFAEYNGPVQTIAANVCQGEAQEIAADYNRYAVDYHPMVIINDNGLISSRINTLKLPMDWLAFRPEQLELVLCKGESETQTVQVCRYTYSGSGMTAPSITRYQYEQTFTLFAASTGRQIGKTTLRGSNPDHCPMTAAASMTQITGSHVQLSDLVKWLKLFGIPLE